MIGPTSSRVKLTKLRAGDAAEMFALLSDARIYEFLPEKPPESVESLEKRYRVWEKGTSPDGSELWLNWIVRSTETNFILGHVQATIRKGGTSAQIAYILGSKYWGQGYALEATKQMLAILNREYGVCTFEAEIDRNNQRSIKLMERLGFEKTGEKTTELLDGSASHDVVMTLRATETRRVFSGAPWEKQVGYCRAIRRGNFISVSGTAPVDDREGVFEPGNGYAQAKRCIEVIQKALKELGAELSDVTRTRMFVTDISRWEEFGRAHGEAFGKCPPATTMVEVKALIAPGMLIEIEADAVLEVVHSLQEGRRES